MLTGNMFEMLTDTIEFSLPLKPTSNISHVQLAGHTFSVYLPALLNDEECLGLYIRPVSVPLNSAVKLNCTLEVVDTDDKLVEKDACFSVIRVWFPNDKDYYGGKTKWKIPDGAAVVRVAVRMRSIVYPAYTSAWFATIVAMSKDSFDLPDSGPMITTIAKECVQKETRIKTLEAKVAALTEEVKTLTEKDSERKKQREEELETARLTQVRMESELAVANARLREDEFNMAAMGAKVEMLKKLVASKDSTSFQDKDEDEEKEKEKEKGEEGESSSDDVVAVEAEVPKASLASGVAAKKRRVSATESHKAAMDKLWNRAVARSAIATQNRSAIMALLIEAEAEVSLLREALREGDFCNICMVAPREVLFMPCRHLTCCTTCSKKITKCSICNGRIKTRVEVVKP